MRPTSRVFLSLSFLLAAVFVTAGEKSAVPVAAPADWTNDLSPITAADWNYDRAAHLLERAGFGGTPEDVEKLAAMTPQQAVDYLVDYESIDDGMLPEYEPSNIYPNGFKIYPIAGIARKALTSGGMIFGIKAVRPGKLPYQPGINEFYTLLISESAEMNRAGQWWTERMVLTPRPFQEKMTLFWHDHFATSQQKIQDFELMLRHIDTMRQRANGNFKDMLIAVSQDPAMLEWLDNKDNVKGKPNENFAREIMELFTMGEGQGYIETDIREMARAFTGWTTNEVYDVKNDKAEFIDDKKLHDDGDKEFLGEKGNFNGYDAINIILKQPQPANYLTKKIYHYFVREDLSPEVHAKLAALFRDSGYEIKPVMKTIFLSRDFYSEPSVGTQVKGPVHYVVSTYRKLGLKSIPGIPDCTDTCSTLGQTLFFPPNVAGWADGRAWINPATLLVRGNFVHTLLFPDPDSFIPPDKVVSGGYKQIPLMFPQYGIQPHVWDKEKQQMVPVSLAAYDRYLAGISSGAMAAMAGGDDKMMMKNKDGDGEMKYEKREIKSKLGQVAAGETFNLAVGLYTGFVQAYNRVKPIPRTTAELDFVSMAKSAKVSTVDGTVEYFCRRLLSVPLSADRHATMVEFLKNEVKSDYLDFGSENLETALRRTVHLIMSAPEYQLG